MIKIENWCVGCRSMGLPCMGNGCPNRHVWIHYCDKCGAELEEWNYRFEGEEEYCDKCSELEDEENEVL